MKRRKKISTREPSYELTIMYAGELFPSKLDIDLVKSRAIELEELPFSISRHYHDISLGTYNQLYFVYGHIAGVIEELGRTIQMTVDEHAKKIMSYNLLTLNRLIKNIYRYLERHYPEAIIDYMRIDIGIPLNGGKNES